MPTTCLMSVPLLWLFILLQCHSQTLHLSHNSASPESVIRLASLIQRESKAPAWEKQVADGALALQASRRGSFLEEGCEEYANGKKMKLRKALREKSTLSKWKDVILHKGKLYRSERKRQGIVFIPNKFCDMRLSNVMWGNAKYYLWRKQRIEDATTVPMKDGSRGAKNNKKMDEENAGLSEPEASRKFRNTTVWETDKSKGKRD